MNVPFGIGLDEFAFVVAFVGDEEGKEELQLTLNRKG